MCSPDSERNYGVAHVTIASLHRDDQLIKCNYSLTVLERRKRKGYYRDSTTYLRTVNFNFVDCGLKMINFLISVKNEVVEEVEAGCTRGSPFFPKDVSVSFFHVLNLIKIEHRIFHVLVLSLWKTGGE